MNTVGTPLLWGGFAVVVAIMLAIDLLLQGRRGAHAMTMKQAAAWSLVWVTLSLLFNAAFWWYLVQTEGRAVADPQALAFLTGYLIEKSLAVDNVFVWLMLFSYFSVPAALQRRVLVYGVLGAIVLRTIMIFTGSWLISQFDWILYIFGAFLLFTGVKMALAHEDESGIGDKPLVRWLRGHLRMTDTIDNEHFFVRKNGLLYATPLMLVLILVELSDVIFAVDSIPAIFAVTTDPFIVLTSNLFAILGLRAMYFLLAGVAERFSMLKYGLAVILVFIGIKMLIVDFYHIPIAVSLGVVFGILIGAYAAWRRGGWLDNAVLSASTITTALPGFFLALLFSLYMGFEWEWFPAYTDPNLVSSFDWSWEAISNVLQNAALPILATAIGSIVGYAQSTRNSVISVADEDFITTARAKGLSNNTVLYKHVLRNAMLPIVTSLGMSISGLIGGSVVIEQIFNWNGMGTLFLNANNTNDYPLMMGIMIFLSGFALLANLITDLCYSLLDPRVKLGGARR